MKVFACAALLGAVTLAAGSAQAVTMGVYSLGNGISISDAGTVNPASVPNDQLTGSNIDSNYALANGAEIITGQNTDSYNPYGAGDTQHKWFSLGAFNFGSASFSLTTPSHMVSLLWGSPAGDDTINLYSGPNVTGQLLGTVKSSDLYNAQFSGADGFDAVHNNDGPGSIVEIYSNEAIGSMVMTSFQRAFEFSDVTGGPVSAVPLPGSVVFFGTGLAALAAMAFASRRRSETL